MKKPIKHIALIGQSLTRALTVEQINGNRSQGPMRRTATVGVIDEEARTVEVAFSSETPVPRWFGDEVLDHSPGAMSQERLSNGAPVLWNHDKDVQIGVVEESRIDGDRTGRAKLRFSKSGRAAEIWADIVDGVIRHVSVGYFIRAIKTEEREGQRDKVTITEWEPYEISMTSVPADPTVGVGRSVGNPPEEPDPTIGDTDPRNSLNLTEGSERMLKTLRHNGALVRAKVDEAGNVIEVVEVLESAEATRSFAGTLGLERAEQQRTAALLELGEQYSAQSLAANAIRDNTSVDEFTRSLLDHVQNNGGQRGNQPLDDNGDIGMSDDEIQNYSFVRAINALCNPNDRNAQAAATFEIEASDAAARSTGQSVRGLMVPPDVLRRALNTSTSGASPGDTGGYAVATDLHAQSFIRQLRNRSVLLGMATPMGGLVGNVDIPGQASGGNAYWLGEDEEAQETTPELRMLGMSPKTLGAYTEASRRMFQQSSMDVEAWLRGELASSIALKVDHTGFYGSGTANTPLGIKNIPGINAVPFAEVQPNWKEIVQLETEISSDNADVAGMAYIGNSKFRGHCKSTEKFAGSSGRTIWESGNTVNGYRAEITNQVETGDLFHGNFADMVVASWGGLDLTVDPFSNSKQGRIRIVAFQDFDFAYRHVESFAFGKKAA